MTPKLVVLGNLLVDDLVFPDGSTRMTQAGGAVLYAALAARLWNVPTGCVSVCGDDFPSEMIDRLRRHAIDLGGVRKLGRPGVRAWLLYEGQVRHLVHRVGCPTHEDVSPMLANIPGEWRSAPAFHLAPMPFGVQRLLVDSLSAEQRSFVSVDPHRPITEDTLDDWREMLSNADAFFPSEDEMLLEQARVDPQGVLRRLVSGRLRFVAYKRGAAGGLLYDARTRRFHAWEPRATSVADQTGAGDAFAMGFVAAHLDSLPVEACLQRAVVSASFAIEAWGSEALLAATPAVAEQRVRDFYGSEACA